MGGNYSAEREAIEEIPTLIREIYSTVAKLEELFPHRRFTPDGHLVGSIGEVLAAHAYGLELLPASEEGHDARALDGRLVQIKATQRRSIGISINPDHLLVIQIQPDGTFEEAYNGPGQIAWEAAGRMQKNGQRPIGLSKLEELMEGVPERSRLRRAAS